MEVHAEVHGLGVPLAVLLKRELCNQKVEKPDILFGEANKSKKGEDFTLLMAARCHRSPGESDGNNAAEHDTISALLEILADSPLQLPSFESNPNYGQKVFVLVRDKESSLLASHVTILWSEESDYLGCDYYMLLSCKVHEGGIGGPAIDHDGSARGWHFMLAHVRLFLPSLRS